MSQKKVDAYKESKANRKAEIEKEKRKKKAGKAFGSLITVVIVLGLAVALVWTGVTLFNDYKSAQPDYTKNEKVIYQYVTESADISDYISGDGNVVINDGSETADEETAEGQTSSEADTAADSDTSAEAETTAAEDDGTVTQTTAQ